MVTASHNPPADNGYKVYLGRELGGEDGFGVQIVPPADAHIATQIDAAAPAARPERPMAPPSNSVSLCDGTKVRMRWPLRP